MSKPQTSTDQKREEVSTSNVFSESKLDEALETLISGDRPKGGGLEEGDYISLGGTQINSEGHIELKDVAYIEEDFFEKVSDTQVQRHDILMTKDGANAGDVAIAWNKYPEIVTNEHVMTLRIKDGLISPYVYYYLLSHEGWKQLKGTVTGSAQKGINKSFASKIKIKHPPLSEQRKISSILFNIDQLIQTTDQTLRQLKRVKRGLELQVFRGYKDKTAYHSLIGDYPYDWNLYELSDLCEIHDAEHFTPDYTELGFPIIRPGDLSPGYISAKDVEKRVDKKTYKKLIRRYSPDKNDIVYSRSQNFAVASKVKTDSSYCIGQDMVVINSKSIMSEFLLHLLNSPVVKKQAIRISSGSTFKRVNLGDIRSFKVPIPDEKSQKKIGALFRSIEEYEKKVQQKRRSLKKLKKGLMQDLLTGKVRTKDKDIEVADEVLER